MSSSEIVTYLVLFIVCVLLSAFFASSETAFISLQRFKLEHMVETKVGGAARVARMIKHPAKLLSVILMGNSFFSTAAAAIATVLAVSYWGEGHGTLIATVIVTIILLIFADATPKTIATQHAEKLSLRFARPLEMVSVILAPLVSALSWITSGFTKMIGVTPVPRSLVSADEIRTMVSIGHKEGTVEPAEAELLNNVFDFGDSPVTVAMIPRTEVVFIEREAKIGDLLDLFIKSPLSRFPVYQGNEDNVVGIVAIKDVLMGMAKHTIDNQSPIDKLIRPAYFVPFTKPLSKLFAEMQDGNYHLAVVIDEYGGTAGVVSLDRLIEEIMGPVKDELSAVGKDYAVIDEHTFQIDGSMHIEEANEEMGLELPTGEFETVAGAVLHILGHIPKQGEQIVYKGSKLVITKMQGMKIEEILITKEKKEKHAAAES